MIKERIYDMDLHDECVINRGDVRIIRVAGGWLYQTCGVVVFVPFNNEFMSAEDEVWKDIIDVFKKFWSFSETADDVSGVSKVSAKEEADRDVLLEEYIKSELDANGIFYSGRTIEIIRDIVKEKGS